MKKRAPRIPTNLDESPLIYIGDNHYVDPATGMVLSRIGHIGAKGYEKAEHDGVKAVSVHRLVYEAVHGPVPKGLVINHINGDRSDNRIANLEAVTTGENNTHAYRPGGRSRDAEWFRGERHPGAKLSNAQVDEIRERAAKGEHVLDLAAAFGISESHAYKLIRAQARVRTSDGLRVEKQPPRRRIDAKLTPDQTAELQRRAAEGEYASDLSKEFGISQGHAYRLAKRGTPAQRRKPRRQVAAEKTVPHTIARQRVEPDAEPD